MTVIKTKNGTELIAAVDGRIDTATAPDFEASVKADLDGVSELVVDFANVNYISSAGLRVLLSAQKIMNKQGEMVVKNCSEEIKEIFEVTGFSDILTIE